MSSLKQNWRRGQNRFCLEERRMEGRGSRWGAGGKMAKTMYAHMNKGIKHLKYNPAAISLKKMHRHHGGICLK
jgi:hypothetical protein